MTAVYPVFTPVKIATGLCPEQSPVGLVQAGLGFGRVAGLLRLIQGCMQVGTDRPDPLQRITLGRRSGPLQKIPTVVPTGVPGSGFDPNFGSHRMPIQIIPDERRLQRGLAPGLVQQFPVKPAPEIDIVIGVAEPAAVLAIGAGSHQWFKVAPPGALSHLPGKPAIIHARLLGIGQFPVPDHDNNLTPFMAGKMGAIA